MTAPIGSEIHSPATTAGGPARWRLMLVGGLALAALGWSGHLATASLGWVELGLCPSGSCGQVMLSSPWARWLGVPVSILSMGVYLAVLCLIPFARSSDPNRRRAAWSALTIIAFMIIAAAVWFTGLLRLYLHRSCSHCASMHLLGMIIAYFIITMAPMGKEPAAMRPRRVLGLAATALAAVGLLVGGQLLPQAAGATEGVDAAAAESGELNMNTPEGKAEVLTHLKADYGDKWDKPESMCHLTAVVGARPGVRVTKSKLYYEVLHEGSGRFPRPIDWVRIHSQGKLWTGEVFKDTFASGQPEEVKVSEMIPGLAEAIVMMPVGSRWRLLLVPSLAYGSAGLPGMVPSDTAVFVEVELLEILPVTAAQAATHQESQ